jgi:hypothetical protein
MNHFPFKKSLGFDLREKVGARVLLGGQECHWVVKSFSGRLRVSMGKSRVH